MIPGSRGSAAALLGVMFVLGALAGGAAVVFADPLGLPWGRHSRPRGGVVERLAADLTLTKAQQDSVRAIFTRHRPDMDSLWGEVRPRFDSVRAVMRAEIRAQLSPEQQGKYKAMIDKMESQYRTRRPDGPR